MLLYCNCYNGIYLQVNQQILTDDYRSRLIYIYEFTQIVLAESVAVNHIRTRRFCMTKVSIS